MLFYNRKRVTHRMGGSSWNCELTQYLSNTCQIYCTYAIHGWKCSSKKYHIHWGMDDRSYFREIKKHCTLKKTSLRLNDVTYKEKHFFFRNNYFGSHPFLMSCYFTKICQYICQYCSSMLFRVYKLIGWNSRNTRKWYEICPGHIKFTINIIESCSGVFTFKRF